MDSNEQRIQKHLVVNSPGQRSEVLTERTETGPRESRLSAGTVALIAVIAIAVTGVVLYLVANRNANEAANRNANLSGQPGEQPPADYDHSTAAAAAAGARDHSAARWRPASACDYSATKPKRQRQR